jgi:hypothetical protein
MRTSPIRLVVILEQAHYEDAIILRSSDLRDIIGKYTWTEAYGAAHRGEIEAVGTRGNPVKYFRVLPASERPTFHRATEAVESGRSTAIARLNMGVFREPVQATAHGPYTDGVTIGYVYQHCAHRGGLRA